MKLLSDIIMNFLVRMIIGIALIFLMNQFFITNEIDISVGINPVTAVTTGTFGIPGVCLLYGIVFYQGF